MLSALRVPQVHTTRGVLPWAPLVGLVLGGIAAAAGWLGARYATPLVGAVLAVAVTAVLTRGLHLDGLADTADGLGPLRGRERALQVMRQGDVGPFGVVTLVLVLLLQVACLAVIVPLDGGWLSVVAAGVTARLVLARCGLAGVPVAAGSTLGRSVAGTVTRGWLVGACGVSAAVLGLPALLFDGPAGAAGLVGSGLVGGLAAELLRRRAVGRLGGLNGDVMGAMAEVAATAALLVLAMVPR